MTSAKNLTMWFDNWAHDLVELGFATKLNDDGIDIPMKHVSHWMVVREFEVDGG